MNKISIMHQILVIDDHLIMREILETILTAERYGSIVLEDTQNAIEVIKNNNISLILLDVGLPGENGYEFLERIKTIPEVKEIPVIFMTGRSEIDDKVKGFELGAVDYITKPFHRLDILMRIKTHIRIVETKQEQDEKLKQISNAHLSFMQIPEKMPEAQFGIYFNSLLDAGGDFYEVIKIDEDNFTYVVADISGHDIATSYIMPAVMALIKENLNSSTNLQERLKKFNKSVKNSILEGKFITALIVLLNKATMDVTLINLGHLPPVYKPYGKPAQLLEFNGDILGVHDDPVFGIMNLTVKEDDRFILYTDGLLESHNDSTVWTKKIDSLPQTLDTIKNVPIMELSETLYKKVRVENNPPDDDILIMSIEV